MKKLVLLLIIALCTSSLFALDLETKIDVNTLYHPSITLDNTTDLPFYSSFASSFDFTPVALNIKNHQFGPFISLLHVSRSIVYNNETIRRFNAVGVGIEYGYYFNNIFKLNTKLGMGIGSLTPSKNLELYTNISLTPTFILFKEKNYDFCITIPVSFVYRKYLLSPSVGIGVSTSFDWLTKQFIKNSSN